MRERKRVELSGGSFPLTLIVFERTQERSFLLCERSGSCAKRRAVDKRNKRNQGAVATAFPRSQWTLTMFYPLSHATTITHTACHASEGRLLTNVQNVCDYDLCKHQRERERGCPVEWFSYKGWGNMLDGPFSIVVCKYVLNLPKGEKKEEMWRARETRSSKRPE